MRVLVTTVVLFLGSVGVLAVPSDAQQPDEKTMAILGYIMGMASTHYCSCERWPSSWLELERFDDRWHADSHSKGAKPVPRIPWADLSTSSVSVAADQHLSVSVRRAGAEPVEIGVVLPDCSEFHPEVVAHLCSNPDE